MKGVRSEGTRDHENKKITGEEKSSDNTASTSGKNETLTF